MRRLPLVLLLALCLALPWSASASRVGDLTGVHYQADAGILGDAADWCRAPRELRYPTGTHAGLLVPWDDVDDYYLVQGSAIQVGAPLDLRLAAWTNIPHADGDLGFEPRPDVDLYVYEPGCEVHLASSRSYDGQESLTYTPTRPGPLVVRVYLYAPVADLPPTDGPCGLTCVPVPTGPFGYRLEIE